MKPKLFSPKENDKQSIRLKRFAMAVPNNFILNINHNVTNSAKAKNGAADKLTNIIDSCIRKDSIALTD